MSEIKSATNLQIKVTLQEVRPPVWRRILVPAGTTLSKFHEILQVTMGWTNSHLHQFMINGRAYSRPGSRDEMDDFEDERRFNLAGLARDGVTKLIYEYDFGDGWRHEVVIEKALPPDPGKKCPLCIAGVRGCPPEDCCGPFGYEDLLKILKDKTHPEYEERKEWCGPYFDPEAFDIGEINESLRQIR